MVITEEHKIYTGKEAQDFLDAIVTPKTEGDIKLRKKLEDGKTIITVSFLSDKSCIVDVPGAK